MANISGTFAADGSSSPIKIADKGLLVIGDSAAANFGSGTVTVQVKTADGTWATSADSYTTADVDTLNFGQPAIVRLTLSGATAPSLFYELRA